MPPVPSIRPKRGSFRSFEVGMAMADTGFSSSAVNAASFKDTKPVYFCKPEEENGYLGQWYPSTFICPASANPNGEKITYKNCEQYMMHQKGLLFAPSSKEVAQILTSTDPKVIKALGRKIPNFIEDKWVEHRYDIIVRGNYMKFTQDEDLKGKLLNTGTRELVEASPLDKIYGIGLKKEKADGQRAKWGLNLLGKALMDVRTRVRKESEGSQ